MIIRHKEKKFLSDVKGPGWRSQRLTNSDDLLPYSFNVTTLEAGASMEFCYKNHIESVYCIDGEGTITDLECGESHILTEGSIYILNGNERHRLDIDKTMTVFCVFDPPLSGNETHDEDGSYNIDGTDS